MKGMRLMYINHGYIQGNLARSPKQVAEGVVLLTVRVRDSRINPITKRRDFHFPSFVVFGAESDKALKYLEKGQEVSIEYKLETRRKEINGETRYFEDKIVIGIQYGRKAETRSKNETPKEEPEEKPMEDN
jgi:single-stranded DNA-binding protein